MENLKQVQSSLPTNHYSGILTLGTMCVDNMNTDKANRLFDMANHIASIDSAFHSVLGPGDGDRRTQRFMHDLRKLAAHEFDADYAERKICGDTSLAVDFYFPDEGTIIEVALGLPNPGSEFEKDVLKALMAQELGNHVHRLVFISRPGAAKKCAQPGRMAVIQWALSKHELQIEVLDLKGEPRVRKRKPPRQVAALYAPNKEFGQSRQDRYEKAIPIEKPNRKGNE